jgi:predicted lipoprotein with Yx(FWY)xxD motif
MVRTIRPLMAVVLGTAMALTTACGTSASTSKPKVTTTTAPTGPPVVKIGTTKYGRVLVDARGFTLYVYDADTYGKAICDATYLCGSAFVSLKVKAKGAVPVGPGLTASMFRTVPGVRGTLVVAVLGKALYRNTGDTAPGQTTGTNRLWHVVGLDGFAIDSR